MLPAECLSVPRAGLPTGAPLGGRQGALFSAATSSSISAAWSRPVGSTFAGLIVLVARLDPTDLQRPLLIALALIAAFAVGPV